MASLKELQRHGQSIWLDYIDRGLLSGGGLQRLVDSGVTGITTNPTIFQKAISRGQDYDDAIRDLLEINHEIDPVGLCEGLTIADVQAAADILLPVYDQTQAVDGYVSLEVSPDLAFSVERTLQDARRLWREVARPNVMIKVPGTLEGVRAIEVLLGEGINVNVTLLFSVERYEQVVRAWARGMAANAHPERVASVASFFVSRVDGKIDPRLDALGTPAAARLRGRTAINNAKVAYQRFLALMAEPEIAAQLRRGARVQRPLWASTSTKDARYRDVLYVESLVGEHTVNTVPPETLDAFLYHGDAQSTLEADADVAARELKALAELGIDLAAVTSALESEGVASFRDSWSALLETLRQKCFTVAKAFSGS